MPVNARIGKIVSWLIVVAVLVSATNAVVRKVFDMSSNSWLELQWVLFAAVFLSVRPGPSSTTSISASTS